MNHPPGMDEELLRRTLRAAAEEIEPAPDALRGIQQRIRTGRTGPRRGPVGRWWSTWSPFAVGAVTAVTLAAVVVGLAGLVRRDVPSRTAGPVAGPPPSVGAAESPGRPGPPLRTHGGTAETRAVLTRGGRVAVYYLGGPSDRPRLYREFAQVPLTTGSTDEQVTAALRRLLEQGHPADPDYRTGWPAGVRLRGAEVSGGIATVDLTGLTGRHVARDRAELTVQQLVWTATAVPGVSGVRLRLDGAPVDRLWDAADVSGVLRRAPAARVLAPVWLISPQHGDTLGRGFEVHVAGILPEATAQLRIRQGDRIVAERLVTLSAAGPAQGEWRASFTLDPGEYTLQAYAVSLVDGREQHLDDHTVTVL